MDAGHGRRLGGDSPRSNLVAVTDERSARASERRRSYPGRPARCPAVGTEGAIDRTAGVSRGRSRSQGRRPERCLSARRGKWQGQQDGHTVGTKRQKNQLELAFMLAPWVKELGPYRRGWQGYFGDGQPPTVLRDLDSWIRRRIRCVVWRPWTWRGRRYEERVRYGIPSKLAAQTVVSPKGPWRMSRCPARNAALSNAEFDRLGLPRLEPIQAASSAEPPDADWHVRWCGRGRASWPSPIPIGPAISSGTAPSGRTRPCAPPPPDGLSA